jgi:hypothetical protein
MESFERHSTIQSVLLGLIIFLKGRTKTHSDGVEMAHACHVDEGRKDNSEELIYRVPGHKEWVRIRVDIVDEQYGNVMKVETERIMDKVKENIEKETATPSTIIAAVFGIGR